MPFIHTFELSLPFVCQTQSISSKMNSKFLEEFFWSTKLKVFILCCAATSPTVPTSMWPTGTLRSTLLMIRCIRSHCSSKCWCPKPLQNKKTNQIRHVKLPSVLQIPEKALFPLHQMNGGFLENQIQRSFPYAKYESRKCCVWNSNPM